MRVLEKRQYFLLAILASFRCFAFEIDSGSQEINIRWDTTVKYSNAFRLKNANEKLISASAANNDDGDRNFKKGLISNRFDVFSELDLVHKSGWGGRLSGAGWYDSVYNTENDNPGFSGGSFPNSSSVPANQFTHSTRRVHGSDAEILDAFVFGKFSLGDANGNFRIGRHSVLWGETLFFGANGIAAGQSPVDVVKLLSVPGTQFKEVVRPVPQISGQLQITPDVSIAGYYQVAFEPNRLPAAGSYFSVSDLLQNGAEQMLLGPFGVAPRLNDQNASDNGQGGLQLRWRQGGTDYGFYWIRFHDKTPQLVTNMVATPFGPFPASYRLVYHEGINAIGASASHSLGEFNIAGELSFRSNQDLASSQAADLSSALVGYPVTDNKGNTAYPVGKTAHFNLSTLASLGPNTFWREATLLGEFAWNRVLSITRNAAAVDTNATRDAWAIRAILEPTYRQVISGMDIGVPIGIGFSPSNSRSMALGPGVMPPSGGGEISIGLNGSYLDAWRFSATYVHYYGKIAALLDSSNSHFTYNQTAGDRDFFSLSLRRTF